jgi:hypothetical protein
MIIYNTTWLYNLLIINVVEREYQEGLLSDKELKVIRREFPVGFYSPNFFIRVALFLLTCVISLFLGGFISLYLPGDLNIHLILLLFAGLGFLALHIAVQQYAHYRSGLDDALLWISFGLLIAAFSGITDKAGENGPLALSAFVFLLALFLAIRFADTLISISAYLALISTIFFALKNMGALGLSLMPFALMLLSALAYRIVRISMKHKQARFYVKCLNALQVSSLISLYAAGNYFLVHSLENALNNTSSTSIRFGWIFWIFTLLLPPAYIYFGLLRKNLLLIRIGLILTLTGTLTFWHYYHPVPAEYALLTAGAVILILAWFLIRYLQVPKNGFTSKDGSRSHPGDELQLESLIIAESASGIDQAPVNRGTKMGGGEFGGGGASGNF